ncbi:hypothetical protein J2R91_002356 [Bradyrhizobium japonicum]|nr:hypothetical protein [Bradyrhizobium japonicum]MCP1961157.1 hypothetical protein [Bradyrhizobium japonicum]
MTSRSSWFRRLSSDLHGTDIACSYFAVATSLEMPAPLRKRGTPRQTQSRPRTLSSRPFWAHCHNARLECVAIPGGLPVGSGGISLSADAHQAGTTLERVALSCPRDCAEPVIGRRFAPTRWLHPGLRDYRTA